MERCELHLSFLSTYVSTVWWALHGPPKRLSRAQPRSGTRCDPGERPPGWLLEPPETVQTGIDELHPTAEMARFLSFIRALQCRFVEARKLRHSCPTIVLEALLISVREGNSLFSRHRALRNEHYPPPGPCRSRCLKRHRPASFCRGSSARKADWESCSTTWQE